MIHFNIQSNNERIIELTSFQFTFCILRKIVSDNRSNICRDSSQQASISSIEKSVKKKKNCGVFLVFFVVFFGVVLFVVF